MKKILTVVSKSFVLKSILLTCTVSNNVDIFASFSDSSSRYNSSSHTDSQCSSAVGVAAHTPEHHTIDDDQRDQPVLTKKQNKQRDKERKAEEKKRVKAQNKENKARRTELRKQKLGLGARIAKAIASTLLAITGISLIVVCVKKCCGCCKSICYSCGCCIKCLSCCTQDEFSKELLIYCEIDVYSIACSQYAYNILTMYDAHGVIAIASPDTVNSSPVSNKFTDIMSDLRKIQSNQLELFLSQNGVQYASVINSLSLDQAVAALFTQIKNAYYNSMTNTEKENGQDDAQEAYNKYCKKCNTITYNPPSSFCSCCSNGNVDKAKRTAEDMKSLLHSIQYIHEHDQDGCCASTCCYCSGCCCKTINQHKNNIKVITSKINDTRCYTP